MQNLTSVFEEMKKLFPTKKLNTEHQKQESLTNTMESTITNKNWKPKPRKYLSYNQFMKHKCYKHKPWSEPTENDPDYCWHITFDNASVSYRFYLNKEDYNKYMLQAKKDQIKWKIEHICKEID